MTLRRPPPASTWSASWARSLASRAPVPQRGRRRRPARSSGSAPADPAAAFAEIGPGVREELAGLETRAVHFPADWPLDRAKAWAAEHVGRRAGGRLATLARPYRACPGLARWLNRAFDAGFSFAPHADEGGPRRVPGRPRRGPPAAARPRPAGPGGGAGYEIDLADPRQRATLPPDLADLPAAGFVNLPEAHALVRYVEPLAGPGLAVTSPFPSQVAVLRKLLARSPRLANNTLKSSTYIEIAVDDPAANGEFAGLAYRIGANVAIVAEEALQPVERDAAAGPQCQDRPSKSRRGGTRWTSALTVVSTTSLSGGAVASRVKVSIRRLTISPFGETRS